MEPFSVSQQTDEGYSEHPLNTNPPSSSLFAVEKNRDAVTGLLSHARGSPNFPAWLSAHISSLSVATKTELALAILDDLPTSIIAQIVQRMNPRLYIDFVQYLPPEVCLKILGYLDPVSLIHVALSCRTWYDLALDRKLWERLYYMEGWKTIPDEIQIWEERMNEGLGMSVSGLLQRTKLSEDGQILKKRALSMSPPGADADADLLLSDADRLQREPADVEMGESSIFGGIGRFTRSTITPTMGDLEVAGSGASLGVKADVKGKAVDRGGSIPMSSPKPTFIRESSMPEIIPGETSSRLPKSALWMWDTMASRYRINWKYLYSTRSKLESNWELGKYTNFQLPHPDFPQEGHRECIYTLQFNSEYLVSGSRDHTIRIWNMKTRRLVRPPLKGHGGSVLCLQFDSDPDEDIIISGSSDSHVILWRFSTGEVMQILRRAHSESVLNVKFDKHVLVTCSKDKSIKIFNRRPLKPGDPGYGELPIDPVPKHLKNYEYALNKQIESLPIKPAYTMLGSLVGHSAAVNAVQICGNEIVSASGDRNVKIWDWTTQFCKRTFLAHNKGIACIQFDGRRIVTGSSDNEVKVFDGHTGVEVASLRGHDQLVRTVQAGFADLPYSREEDAAAAKRVDEEYFKAVENGLLSRTPRHGNAGSSRPENITAYGAKIPPGGGGGKYARIVSGSYDTSIILWRRDKEGAWKAQHHLKQEEAAAAAQVLDESNRQQSTTFPTPSISALLPARRPIGNSQGSVAAEAGSATTPAAPAEGSAGPSTLPPTVAARRALTANPMDIANITNPNQVTLVEEPIFAAITPSSQASLMQLIDLAVPQGPSALQEALSLYPTMLTLTEHLLAAIGREPSPFVRSQMRQVMHNALINTRNAQSRARHGAMAGTSAAAGFFLPVVSSNNAGGSSRPSGAAVSSSQTLGGLGTAPSASSATVLANADGAADDTGIFMPPTAGGSATVPANTPPAPISLDQAATAAIPAHRAVQAQHAQAQAQAQIQNAAQVQVEAQAHAQQTHALALAQHHAHHPHLAGADAPGPARVFKLQFDARRIICCSQTSVIVGWDFCNGDPNLEEACRFFGTVE